MTSVAVAKVRLLRLLVVVGVVLGVLLFCFLGINAASASTDDEATPNALGSITGVVRDQQGAPLAGIKLSLYRSEYGSYPVRVVTTTVTGEYKASFLPTGLYRLQASDAGKTYGPVYYQQSSTLTGATVVPIAGNHVGAIDFALAPAAYLTGTATILTETVATGGYVTLYAKVDKFWEFVSSNTITSTGVYTIGPLPPGVFRICATTYAGIDSFMGCYGGGVAPADAADITLAAGEIKTNVDIATGVEQYNGAITGTVTTNGAPLAGIRVALSFYNGASSLVYTLTNASGGYTLGGLSDGYYYVEFADPAENYTTAYHKNQRTPERAEAVMIMNSTVISNVDAVLFQAGTISGTIRLSNGQSVANAQLQLYYKQNRFGFDEWIPLYRSSYTDKDGRFALRLLWPDTYRLCVYGSLGYGECYGSSSYYGDITGAQDLVVQPGSVISDVNMILGPDFLLYLPVIAQ